jgi:hypothetical protein
MWLIQEIPVSNKMVDVILHVDEDTTDEDRESFRDVLLAIDGVLAATFREDKAHLVVIEYDPERVKASAFVAAAKDNGWHAELVGL